MVPNNVTNANCERCNQPTKIIEVKAHGRDVLFIRECPSCRKKFVQLNDGVKPN